MSRTEPSLTVGLLPRDTSEREIGRFDPAL